MTQTSETGHIFLSYRRTEPDSAFALRLANDLRVAGHRVWMDVAGIEGGEAWNQEIQRALDDCYAYIILLSPEALESRWVRNELLYALQNKPGRVYPVTLHEVKLPVELIAVQYVDFQPDYRAGLAKLLASLPPPGWDPLQTAPAMKTPAHAPPPPSTPRSLRSASKKPGLIRRWWRFLVLAVMIAALIAVKGTAEAMLVGGLPSMVIALSHAANMRWGRSAYFVIVAGLFGTIFVCDQLDLLEVAGGILSISLLVLLPAGTLWSFIDAVRGKGM